MKDRNRKFYLPHFSTLRCFLSVRVFLIVAAIYFILTTLFIFFIWKNTAYSAIYTISPGHIALTNDNGDDGNAPGGAGTTADPAWSAWNGSGVNYYNRYACQRDTTVACSNISLHDVSHGIVAGSNQASCTSASFGFCMAGNTAYHCNINGSDSGDSFTTEGTAPGVSTENWTDSWTSAQTVTVTVTAGTDGGSGMSGCTGGLYYCTGAGVCAGSCSPVNQQAGPVGVPFGCAAGSVCNNHIRHQSKDALGNASAINCEGVRQDRQAPTTTDNWTDVWTSAQTVTVTLSPSDGSGSGLQWTKYCVDTANTCDPTTGTSGTSASVTCGASSVCTQYVRYASRDNVNNTETTKSKTVRQDSQAPTVIDLQTGDDTLYLTAPGTIYNVDFSDNANESLLANIQYAVWDAPNMSSGTGAQIIPWSNIASYINAASYTINWSINFGAATAGYNYVTVRAYDNAGNVSSVATDVFYVRKDIETEIPTVIDLQTGDDTLMVCNIARCNF